MNKSHKYAKRQMTWFKRNKEIHWIKPEEKGEILELVKTFLNTKTMEHEP